MRHFTKLLLNGFFALLTLPMALLFWAGGLLLNKDSLFSSLSQAISLFPGKIGSYIRANTLHWVLPKASANCHIGFGTLFSHCDTDIGQGAYIGPQCNVGKCSIGHNCLLGSGVHILSGKGQHNLNDLNIPVKDQGGTFEKITIGEDTWVGNGAIIMANIGAHCVIAAGSVVVNDVEDFAIVAGNPARFIKSRKD